MSMGVIPVSSCQSKESRANQKDLKEKKFII
jgi:hypothetical protein